MTEKRRIDQAAQMVQIIKKYQEGATSLRELVSNVELSLATISDQGLKDGVFDSLVALEEVYARTQIGEFDFEKDGRSVVDRAVRDILSKIGRVSS